jgi:hypothetical protein
MRPVVNDHLRTLAPEQSLEDFNSAMSLPEAADLLRLVGWDKALKAAG